MTVSIRLDTTPLTARLSALEQSQVPFALAKAINQTGLDFQVAERERMALIFTERRPDFIEKQGVKLIGGFATKGKPFVTFGVDPKADFLTKFEIGGIKSPRTGQFLAIPVDAKRNKRDIITPGNRPRSLLDRLQSKSGAGGVFILKERRGNLPPGIYQRSGRGGHELKFLYALDERAKILPELQFVATFERIVQSNWRKNWDVAFADALRTAR
jgi:hypothetical protein